MLGKVVQLVEGKKRRSKPSPPAAVCGRVRDLGWLLSLVGTDGGSARALLTLHTVVPELLLQTDGRALRNFQVPFALR